jgi:hypothetical protein
MEQRPFPAPLPLPQRPPLEVDPSERNPYNDPDWSPFLITQYPPTDAGDIPQGGLLGRLLSVLAEQARSGASGDGVPNSRMDATIASSPLDSEDRPVRILARRVVS